MKAAERTAGWGAAGTPEPSPWALDYASTPVGLLAPAPPGKVRLDLVTDPWSVWCWGFEPVRRALALRYPSIEFNAYVGGMFERLPDPREMGFDIQRFFASVQYATGMPTSTRAGTADRPQSTYPACVHVHAVRLLAPTREAAFLRALREAAYLDGRNVSRPDVAADAAAAVGLASDEFLQALASGEPEREFRDRLQVLERLGIYGYPTLLFTWGTKTARVDGFQGLPMALSIAESLSGRLHPAIGTPALEASVPAGERVATREVAEALGVSIEEAYDRLREAEDAGRLTRTRARAADVWARA